MVGVSGASAAIIFDFVDDTDPNSADPLDGGGVGAMMTETDGSDTVTLTTIDILFPEYEDPGTGWVATGNTLSAKDGDGGSSNIAGTADALGLNNPSIGNTDFLTIGGGSESGDFNTGEAWIFSFDEDVTFANIEFESAVSGNLFSVLVGGSNIVTLDAPDGNVSGTGLGGLNGLTISSGTEITFLAGGPVLDTDYRIESLTVNVVPEPATLGLLSACAVGAFIIRRFRV
ncbi:hypothetical protein PDESU_00296 [Pontiella desulfatans]|uniref:Ice-binding protein C-terminal domain-containing protein n=2 Tax=Pontiella desulfatans TaxID=2750659 RepID=A0A6C2TVR5_PONDE|nr:hypothetical protein PDESU_00296 [Pontiella desulfatans]